MFDHFVINTIIIITITRTIVMTVFMMMITILITLMKIRIVKELFIGDSSDTLVAHWLNLKDFTRQQILN